MAIPSVPGLPVLGNLLELRRDRLALQHRVAREYGDIAWIRTAFMRIALVSSPDLAREVLVDQEDAFVKSMALSVFAKPLLGDGLLSSEHAFHQRQRRLMAPAFAPKRLATYADVMVERSIAAAERMLAAGNVDISHAMMQLTLEIVGKTLFGVEVGGKADEVGEALTLVMHQLMRSLLGIVPIPPSIPTPGHLRARKSIEALDRIIYRIIDERRRSPEDRGDVLSILLAARDDDGSRMTDKQVRDEAMTLFLAGHETTANALAWTLFLLAENPRVRTKLEHEVDTVLGSRRPSYADATHLPYATMVLKESMRLYPPAYILGRRATRPVSIGGHELPQNQLVLINIAGIHRRPVPFDHPDDFRPERFAGDEERTWPKLAYMPFGAGPRICIGNHFALLEGQLALVVLIQRMSLARTTEGPIPTESLLTLRPKGGIPMRATARAHRAAN